MIYDSNKVSNAQRVNDVVMKIRARQMKNLPVIESKNDVKSLISVLNVDVCERMLNQVFSLPWIPLKEFNGLSLRQLAEYIDCSIGAVRRYFIGVKDDMIKVSSYELRKLAEKVKPRSVYTGSSYTVSFGNGTVIESVGTRFSVVSPRAIAYIIVSLASYNKTCNMLLMRFYDSICNDEEWILPIQTTAPSEPLTDAYEAAPQPVIVAETSSEPAVKPAPMAFPEPLESAVIKFLNSLKPGTKIQIVIPG